MNDRVELMNLVAGVENIEFRYPLFDVDLIGFYLSIPGDMKHKFRSGRYIHRMAMQDLLPQEIQWRSDKHGTINPGLARIFSNDSNTIKSVLLNFSGEMDHQEEVLFDTKIIEKIIASPDENLIQYKSVVNKFFQLNNFYKIIEKKSI